MRERNSRFCLEKIQKVAYTLVFLQQRSLVFCDLSASVFLSQFVHSIYGLLAEPQTKNGACGSLWQCGLVRGDDFAQDISLSDIGRYNSHIAIITRRQRGVST